MTVRAATDRADQLGELAARGEITVPVEVMPFEQAGAAIDRQASKMVRGKLVLQIGDNM